MSDRPAARPRTLRQVAAAAGLLGLALTGAACNAQDDSDRAASKKTRASASPRATSSATEPARSAAQVSANVAGPGVRVDKVVRLTARHGTLRSVTVRGAGKPLAGALSGDGTTWSATGRLQPGTTYHVRGVASDDAGLKAVERTRFTTERLPLARQTYPSFAPVAGSTVGVGMPVIVRFDVPVTDKKAIEKHLKVVSTSHQRGAWRWISGNEVHWRPAHYWKPGSDVTVTADIDSVPAGKGIYGQLSRTSTFHVGRSVVTKVDAARHRLRTFINGELARTIPITTGKPGFTTRSGTKVIIEKFRHKRMDSETIGIAHGSANGYDLDDVEYAMRVTYSGEFLHAAPWSVGSQGYANVSHGCTGMSTANAAWLYANSKPGDVVVYTGTDRPMTLTNGYGDWNQPFRQYARG